MEDMRTINVILSIMIIRDEHRLKLNQAHYIEKVFKRFNMFVQI